MTRFRRENSVKKVKKYMNGGKFIKGECKTEAHKSESGHENGIIGLGKNIKKR